MSNQLLKDNTALRMFFTEPVYITTDAAKNNAVNLPIPEEKIAAAEVHAQSAAPAFEFIGKNNRHILILVNDDANKVSSLAGTELLRNIVKHLKFDKDDFALLNYANYPDASFPQLKAFFSCNSIIVFGLKPAQLGLNEVSGLVNIVDDTQVVFASGLNEMADSLEAKKAFWNTLKMVDKW